MLKSLWHAMPFTGAPPPVVNQIPLIGTIAVSGRPGRVLNFAALETPLKRAFTAGNPKAVVLSINSPGGSPVQSRMILSRIRHLAEEHNVPVIAHIEDVGASGGYMLAVAADDIYADPFALVGSIGVISGGFGFPEAIAKLGVERRVYTAGENKSQLDPFQPEDPEDVRRLEGILDLSHKQFIELVKERRGGRIKAPDHVLFQGEFWLAPQAAEHGLIDGAEDLNAMLRRRFGDRVKTRRIDVDKRSALTKLLTSVFGGVLDPDEMLGAIERRASWARFGR